MRQQHFIQIFENPIEVLQNVIIHISNHLKAERFQIRFPPPIPHDLMLLAMNITVNFNHEGSFCTIEIHDVRSYPMLSPKLETLKLLHSKF